MRRSSISNSGSSMRLRRPLSALAELVLVPALVPALVLALAAGPLRAAPPLVKDGAALMTAAERAHLADYHHYLLGDHGIDYRVVTAEDTGDINRFAVERFEAMEIGGGGQGGRGGGLLLVIDPGQDRVRLEVGYALEGVFPDAFVAYVEQRQMVPFFRAGRVADGILAATELIVARAQRAAANAGFEGEVWMAGSGGAGATADAALGQGWNAQSGGDSGAGSPGRTPEETLARYLAAMEARDGDPNLAIYTPDSRRMLQGWVMTPAQMTNVVRTYRRCHAQDAKLDPAGRLAVIRYPEAERQCAPWFFQRIGGGWALDLTMMQRALRFGRANAWRFDPAASHAYGYAFEDWRFDTHGFPIPPR